MSSNEPAMLDDESSNIDTLPTDQGQARLNFILDESKLTIS